MVCSWFNIIAQLGIIKVCTRLMILFGRGINQGS